MLFDSWEVEPGNVNHTLPAKKQMKAFQIKHPGNVVGVYSKLSLFQHCSQQNNDSDKNWDYLIPQTMGKYFLRSVVSGFISCMKQ